MLIPHHRVYYMRFSSKGKESGNNYEFTSNTKNWSTDPFVSDSKRRWYLRCSYICLKLPNATGNWYVDQNSILVYVKNAMAGNSYDTIDDNVGKMLIYSVPRPYTDTSTPAGISYASEFNLGHTTNLGMEITNPEMFNGSPCTLSLEPNASTGGGAFNLPGTDEIEIHLQLTCVEYPDDSWQVPVNPKGIVCNQGFTDNPSTDNHAWDNRWRGE